MPTRFNEVYRYAPPLLTGDLVARLIDASETKYPWDAPNHDYVGVEIEIEGVTTGRNALFNDWWNTTEDGSLRRGLEYRTHAIPPKGTPYAIHNLFDFLQITGAKPDFSERTSIHVHMDWRNQTDEDLVKLILTYLPFEKYLYLFAGPERYKNNFCIPISDTNITNLRGLVRDYEKKKLNPEMVGVHLSFLSKYTGLNVNPLLSSRAPRDGHTASGSIEFRHMAGTGDRERIITWVAMLQYLKDFVIRTPYEQIKEQLVTLNTTSRYAEFATAVFGPHGNRLLPLSLSWKLLSQSLALTKQALSTGVVVSGKDFLRSPLAAHLQTKHDKDNEAKKELRDPVVDEFLAPDIEEDAAPQPEVAPARAQPFPRFDFDAAGRRDLWARVPLNPPLQPDPVPGGREAQAIRAGEEQRRRNLQELDRVEQRLRGRNR